MHAIPTHIIHRVNVDINTNTRRSAKQINKDVDRYVHKMILPAIEEILAKKYATYSVRLNQLDVDLDFVSEKKINTSQFTNAIEIAVENAIQQHKREHQPLNKKQKETSPSQQYVSDEWAVLLHFLKSGSLPWFVSREDTIERWIALCAEQLSKNQAKKNDLEAFATLIANNKTVQNRILKQLPENFIELFVSAYHSKDLAIAWRKLLEKLPVLQNYTTTQYFSVYALQIIANSFEKKTLNSHEITREIGFHFKQWKQTIAPKQAGIEKIAELIDAFKELLSPLNVSIDKNSLVEMWNEVLSYHDERTQHTQIENVIETQNDLEAAKPLKENVPTDMFNFAGLIILHPYLKMFFKNIGVLTENDNQISAEQYDLAAHSLYFLATGQTNGYESDMQFIKWLLNIPEGVVIDRYFKLEKKVRVEAENLLSSVVENWSALKNSSNDTLRAMFFQRAASLKEGANGYQLHFERKAQDILLDQLPWGIGFVKLSWKQKSIQIIW